MASSSGMDAATAALIAQLVAEDLGESYEAHTQPIGASIDDYEEPLSSYERQCLDAENDPDGDDDEECGWGPGSSDGLNEAVAPNESQSSTEPAYNGPWDSRFINDDGEVQELFGPDEESQVAVTGDDNRSDPRPSSPPMSEGLAGSTAHVDSHLACNAPTKSAGEIRSISGPVAQPTQPASDAGSELTQERNDHTDPNESSTPLETLVPLSPVPSNEPLLASTGWQVGVESDDALTSSSHTGIGNAVRAYDEFKLGLRGSERRWRETRVAHVELSKKRDSDDDDDDDDDDSEEESEIEDEDLPFIHIPWPKAEQNEVLSRREDSEVVEIRVGDDETLESILRDISLRDERRRKGKGVERDEGRGREELLGRNDVAAWW